MHKDQKRPAIRKTRKSAAVLSIAGIIFIAIGSIESQAEPDPIYTKQYLGVCNQQCGPVSKFIYRFKRGTMDTLEKDPDGAEGRHYTCVHNCLSVHAARDGHY
jgi:hypothetical protein